MIHCYNHYMKSFLIQLDEPTCRALNRIAPARKRRRSQIIREAIRKAISFVLNDTGFRSALAHCENPYGDGNTAEKTVDILRRLRLSGALLTKWIALGEPLLD